MAAIDMARKQKAEQLTECMAQLKTLQDQLDEEQKLQDVQARIAKIEAEHKDLKTKQQEPDQKAQQETKRATTVTSKEESKSLAGKIFYILDKKIELPKTLTDAKEVKDPLLFLDTFLSVKWDNKDQGKLAEHARNKISRDASSKRREITTFMTDFRLICINELVRSSWYNLFCKLCNLEYVKSLFNAESRYFNKINTDQPEYPELITLLKSIDSGPDAKAEDRSPEFIYVHVMAILYVLQMRACGVKCHEELVKKYEDHNNGKKYSPYDDYGIPNGREITFDTFVKKYIDVLINKDEIVPSPQSTVTIEIKQTQPFIPDVQVGQFTSQMYHCSSQSSPAFTQLQSMQGQGIEQPSQDQFISPFGEQRIPHPLQHYHLAWMGRGRGGPQVGASGSNPFNQQPQFIFPVSSSVQQSIISTSSDMINEDHVQPFVVEEDEGDQATTTMTEFKPTIVKPAQDASIKSKLNPNAPEFFSTLEQKGTSSSAVAKNSSGFFNESRPGKGKVHPADKPASESEQSNNP